MMEKTRLLERPESDNLDCPETTLYTVRWVILLALFFQNSLCIFEANAFTTPNDVFVEFFKLPYEATDWLYLSHVAALSFFSPFLAWFWFQGMLGVRRLIITQAVSISLAYTFLVAGFLFPKLFPLVIVGQFINGVAYSISSILPTLFAVRWFPIHQVKLVIGICAAGIYIGSVFAYTLTTNVLQAPKLPPLQKSNKSNEDFSSKNVTIKEVWFSDSQRTLLIIFCPLLSASILVLIFEMVFAQDNSPTPPNFSAPDNERVLYQEIEFQNGETKTFQEFRQKVTSIMNNWTFLVLSTICGIAYFACMIDILFVSQLLRVVEQETALVISANSLSGYMSSVYSIGLGIGLFIAESVFAKFSNYYSQATVGISVQVASSLGVLLSFYFKSVALMFVFYAVNGVSVTITSVPIFKLLAQHFSQTDHTFLSFCMFSIIGIMNVVVCEICRLLIIYTQGINVLIVKIVYCSLGVFLWCEAKFKKDTGNTSQQSSNTN